MDIFSNTYIVYTRMLSSKYLTKDYDRMHDNSSRHKVLTSRGMENRVIEGVTRNRPSYSKNLILRGFIA